MKKFLVYGGLGLLIVAIAGYITMQYFLGSIVKAGVNKFGPAITHTKVELGGASLSPLSGDGTLTDLAVGNPAGWSAHNAFQLGKIHLSMEPRSVFAGHIVINELIIEKPEFLYETKIVTSNIADLLKNIERSVGAKEGEPKTKTGQPVKMVIKKLSIREGKVTVGLGPTAVALPLQPIELTDLGTAEGGITPAQVAVAVMRSVTTQIVAVATQALAKLGGTSGANTLDIAKEAGAALRGILGGKKPEPAKQEPAKK
jgi:hypothetical protein